MRLIKRLLSLHIGPFPAALLCSIVVVLFFAAEHNLLSNDLIGGLSALMATGYILTCIGNHIPVLNRLGGPSLLCVLIPSLFLGYHLIPSNAIVTINSAMDADNVLYLYIASLVVGSILGIDRRMMERHVLVHRVSKRFLPLICGSISACIVAPLVGMLFSLNPWHSFLFIVTPILSGGLGEGILPLALAYSEITDKSRVELGSLMIPAALIANLFAVLSASGLSRLSERYPSLNGIRHALAGSTPPPHLEDNQPINIDLMAAGLLIICAMYTCGRLLSPLFSLPATIVMIMLVVLLKFFKLIPEPLEVGAFQVYKSISKALTPAILVGLSILYIPWDVLISILKPGYLAVCISTVFTMTGIGFLVSRLLKQQPIDTAIICACHSGFGGMGNMAILTASKRLNLMPFAEVATSLGGAIMVILATILLRANWPALQGML
jgi:malate:Na+ symporter